MTPRDGGDLFRSSSDQTPVCHCHFIFPPLSDLGNLIRLPANSASYPPLPPPPQFYLSMVDTPSPPKKQKMSSSADALEAALSTMTDAANPAMYDVTIVCTTDDHQAAYWTERLSAGVCHSKDSGGGAFPMVLAVSEDWAAGGAGNGLGTLYAYKKAAGVAKARSGVDLDDLLAKGEISAALYHTAGKGTRLAPLPASENNNKPGVVSAWAVEGRRLAAASPVGVPATAPLGECDVVLMLAFFCFARLARLTPTDRFLSI